MSDDCGPVFKRPRSHQDRDVFTSKAKTPTSIPEFVWEDATGQVEGPELLAIRNKRPTEKRVEHVELRLDRLEPTVNRVEVAVADIRGDTKAQNVALKGIEKTLDRMAVREDLEHADDVAARKTKREAIIKVALYLITGGLLGKILHTLGAI